MRIRTRFAVILGTFALVLIALSVVMVFFVLSRHARLVDEEMARIATARGLRVLADDCDTLQRAVTDWAAWDDTGAFLEPRDPRGTGSDRIDGTLKNLNLQLLALFDPAGAVVVARTSSDVGPGIEELPGVLLAHVRRPGGVLAHVASGGSVSGFHVGDGELWILAAAPIRTRNGAGPSRGTILMGRRIGVAQTLRLRGLIHESAALFPLPPGGVPSNVTAHALGPAVMAGRTGIADLCGAGGVGLEIRTPRDAFAQSLVHTFYLVGWVLVCGAAITVCTFWFLDRWVLEDIMESVAVIQSGIVSVTAADGNRARLRKRRADEIGQLTDAINAMLEAFASSQERLRISEARYRELVEAMPEPIVGVDDDARVILANRALVGLCRVADESILLGQSLDQALPALALGVRERLPALAEGSSAEFGPVAVNAADTQRWLMASLTRLAATGAVRGYVLVSMHDVTARVAAEREAEVRRSEAVQSQKLAALGTLVAGVAHEVSNPNGIVSLNMSVLQRMLERIFADPARHGVDAAVPALAPLRQELGDIIRETLDASTRIAGFVASLKRFAQPGTGSRAERVDIHACIRRSCDWVRHDLAQRQVDLRLELAADLPAVRGDMQELQQVFVNLVQNACHAVDRPGTPVTVGTAFDPVARTVTITVRDQGRGIRQEDLERVLDPFFTTRREVGGSGLGLSIAVLIVNAHGGRLRIESKPGEGTCVSVTLPAAEGESAA